MRGRLLGDAGAAGGMMAGRWQLSACKRDYHFDHSRRLRFHVIVTLRVAGGWEETRAIVVPSSITGHLQGLLSYLIILGDIEGLYRSSPGEVKC